METREEVVRAWVCVDDERLRSGGWTIGVKDVFDTADFPTEYGSSIYKGHQPSVDAAVVTRLRDAGAVIVGKTVTAEFAMFSPGPTTNPHRTTHTPGGSSSGSAAAVAAGHVDAAMGTQTAGSVIRPASFCGVYGFKPTFGTVPIDGVKLIAPSLDTVGWFARDVDGVERVWRAVANGRGEGVDAPRFALVRTEQWADAAADSQAAVLAAGFRLGASERELPDELVGLAAVQPVVQAYEAARSLARERENHGDELSEQLRGILDWGAAIGADEYTDVLSRTAAARECWFDGVDVVITPAVVSEAPEGLASTGDPRFCRLWNLLGWPVLSVPAATGATGLPVGIQLVARPGRDADLFVAARRLEEVCR